MTLRLIDIETGNVITAPLAPGWVTLPDGSRVSPAIAGWEGGGELTHDEETGEWSTGPARYRIEEYEPDPVEPPRPTVLKSTIIARLTDQQLAMVAAAFAQPANLRLRERWYAADKPVVYCDDADAVGMVLAIGGDPETILAPG